MTTKLLRAAGALSLALLVAAPAAADVTFTKEAYPATMAGIRGGVYLEGLVDKLSEQKFKNLTKDGFSRLKPDKAGVGMFVEMFIRSGKDVAWLDGVTIFQIAYSKAQAYPDPGSPADALIFSRKYRKSFPAPEKVDAILAKSFGPKPTCNTGTSQAYLYDQDWHLAQANGAPCSGVGDTVIGNIAHAAFMRRKMQGPAVSEFSITWAEQNMIAKLLAPK